MELDLAEGQRLGLKVLYLKLDWKESKTNLAEYSTVATQDSLCRERRPQKNGSISAATSSPMSWDLGQLLWLAFSIPEALRDSVLLLSSK